jgi:hypothetical protein
MKTLVFILFFYFSIFSACAIYAGNNTMTANYPAPAGSYNKVVLQNLQGADPTCSASNAGLLFMHTDASNNKSLEMCTSDGTAKAVPYPEVCFNRFCSWSDNTGDLTPQAHTMCPSFSTGCPNGFTWIPTDTSLPLPYEDVITTYSSSTSYYRVQSGVCCSCGDSLCTAGVYSTVNPQN